MRLGLFLYRIVTRLLAPFAPLVMRRRAERGKENSLRINERFARRLIKRPQGRLIWFHSASVGESMVQLEVAARLLDESGPFTCLFTCQTLTGADAINARLEDEPAFSGRDHLQQMAPLDLPGPVSRFVHHWSPDLAIFAEGEIWPNLLGALRKLGIPTALINARMTEKSVIGWGRWRATSRDIFGGFDLLLAADTQTQTGLSYLAGRDVACPGNLKSSLPAPSVDMDELESLRMRIGPRPVLVAASTHTGEEALVLDAVLRMPERPFLVIAPRHPERGDEIEGLLRCSALEIARRSRDDDVSSRTGVLLADTMGEMGLWYRLASCVYLGGGHTPGVGGHNPLEPIRLGRRVLTGPSLFNFRDVTDKLIEEGALTIVQSSEELIQKIEGPAPSADLLARLEEGVIGPMRATLDALSALLNARGTTP